jgi:hypothetical protein
MPAQRLMPVNLSDEMSIYACGSAAGLLTASSDTCPLLAHSGHSEVAGFMSAFGGKADAIVSDQLRQLLTQSRHVWRRVGLSAKWTT